MRQALGETRTSIQRNHAMISPDSHERTALPNWPGSDVIYVITPHIGARFAQYFVDMPADAIGNEPLHGVQRFLFVMQGKITISLGDKVGELATEDYAFLAPNDAHEVTALERSRILVIEKPYVGLQGEKPPVSFIASVGEVPRGPMKGDDRLQLQKLLPQQSAYDCEVNIMDFAPGASLPYVETHFMEHGLLMLNGGGVYRLDSAWYSVEAGDIIWMGPYAAQWFGAIGRANARYLIYKNWNRDALASS